MTKIPRQPRRCRLGNNEKLINQFGDGRVVQSLRFTHPHNSGDLHRYLYVLEIPDTLMKVKTITNNDNLVGV